MKQTNYSIKKLIDADHTLQAPFSLDLPEQTITIETVLRHLPKKRLTCVANHNGKRVLLKLFYAGLKRHARHAYCDRRGILKLLQAGIATPALLHADISCSQNYSMLTYEYLPQAQTLQSIWEQETNKNQREDYLLHLIELVTKMHQAGIFQADMHFDNVLISQNNWFVIDGSAICGTPGKRLSARKCISNMALLLSHVQRKEAVLINIAIRHYLSLTHHSLEQVLYNRLAHVRNQHERAYVKKLFRSCTDHVFEKTFYSRKGYVRNNAGRAANALMDMPKLETADYLKQGNSSTVYKQQVKGEPFVVKRYNIKSMRHALKRAFQKTRAANTWYYSYYLKLIGLSTPTPILFYEKRLGFIRNEAMVVYPYCAGETLDVVFSKCQNDPDKWQPLARQVIEVFNQLKDVQLCHGDLKATNILINEDKVILLDLDAMRHYRSYTRWQANWRKDCFRFLENFTEQAKIRQYCESLLLQQELLP